MLPGLIFDLDGTLVDSLPGISASLNHALATLGLPTHSLATVRGFVGDGLQMLIIRGLPEGASAELIDETTAIFKTHYDTQWRDGTVIYPGIVELLGELQERGYPLAILSNKTHDFTTAIAEEIFPAIRFACVLGKRDDDSPLKPHPRGALDIAKALHREPSQCIIIGDSTVDFLTAQNADMRAISCTWGYHDIEKLRAAGASRFIHHPAELLTAIA